MKEYTMTSTDLTGAHNDAIQFFVKRMVDEGIIDEETKNKMLGYSIVLSSKGLFGRFWDKLWKNDDNMDKFIVVKISGSENLIKILLEENTNTSEDKSDK